MVKKKFSHRDRQEEPSPIRLREGTRFRQINFSKRDKLSRSKKQRHRLRFNGRQGPQPKKKSEANVPNKKAEGIKNLSKPKMAKSVRFDLRISEIP